MDFESLKNNLQILDGTDRTSYLIDLAKKSNGIPNNEKNNDNRIWGCASISFLKVKNIEPVVNINTDSESVLVKGLLFILDCYVNGKNSNEILSINEKDLMEEIGMKNIVTSQRMNGFYSAIVLLKKQGGRTSKLLMAKFRPKKNSLFNAIQGRDLELAKKLIKDGADIEERGGRESGKRSATPLYYAAYNVDPAMTKLLLESGANVNAVDYQGEIPLHTAIYHSFPNVEEDRIEVIKMLIENGSDVNKVKSLPRKLTPLDFAKDPNGKIADLLRKHGGKTGEELKGEGK